MAKFSTRKQYEAKFAKSKEIFVRSEGMVPRGVAHDAWKGSPLPVFMKQARGSHIWDLDGNEVIDYFGGHGGMMLGHAHPVVVRAVLRSSWKRGSSSGPVATSCWTGRGSSRGWFLRRSGSSSPTPGRKRSCSESASPRPIREEKRSCGSSFISPAPTTRSPWATRNPSRYLFPAFPRAVFWACRIGNRDIEYGDGDQRWNPRVTLPWLQSWSTRIRVSLTPRPVC
jgi:Aminotransferase class-III